MFRYHLKHVKDKQIKYLKHFVTVISSIQVKQAACITCLVSTHFTYQKFTLICCFFCVTTHLPKTISTTGFLAVSSPNCKNTDKYLLSITFFMICSNTFLFNRIWARHLLKFLRHFHCEYNYVPVSHVKVIFEAQILLIESFSYFSASIIFKKIIFLEWQVLAFFS
jgi:hypothetical protein